MALPASVDEMLRGADEQFEMLRSEVAAFFGEPKPYEVVTEHHNNFTEHTQRLVFTEPFPGKRWSRMFYLGVQQLRSALDHMIYAIAVHESREDPPPNADTLAFPVMTNPGDIPMWKVSYLSDPVKAVIKDAQPHLDLERNTLWQLEKFNAPDKHRFLRMSLSRSPTNFGSMTGGGGGKVTSQWHLVALESEAPSRTVRTEHPAPDMKMDSIITPEVCVERVGGNGQAEDFVPMGAVAGELRAFAHDFVARLARAADI